MGRRELPKIRFYDADVGYENLRAEKKNEDLYVIKSIPYFIYNISIDDVVRVHRDETDHVLCFSELVEPSSHKTIRVRTTDFTLDDERGDALLDAIEDFGCDLETLPPRLIAVDLPSESVAKAVTEFLTRSSFRWEWAKPSS